MHPVLEILARDDVDEYVFYSLTKEEEPPEVSAFCTTLDDDMTQEEFVDFCGSQGHTVKEITSEEARNLVNEHPSPVFGGHFYDGPEGREFHQT